MESNINTYYEGAISDLASRADIIYEEQPELDESEVIAQAIDEGFIYGADQAYVVAHAYQNGFINWGEPIDEDGWAAIYDDLCGDILEEYRQLQEDKKNAAGNY